MKLPELLAPAGDWNSFVAAVQNGADAVYLGVQQFNARQDAANFSLEQVAEAVAYAHMRGVRIYITVNTLVSDDELPGALRLLEDLNFIGVDGIIIQDLGLAVNARISLPQLPLHGSTQMTIHNLSGAKFLGELGFTRVVVAREQSLDELRQIVANSPIEVEAFVHGALCFSYSGNCLLSSMIGGRSGNRGRCAQPCRLEYALVDQVGHTLGGYSLEGAHLLSPKDLNTLDYLQDLVDAGVHSLKIEGRMKRPEYVATVVKAYRTALDMLADGVEADERGMAIARQKVEQIFNRGFTTAYLYGNPGRDLMSYSRPHNRGRFLGRVVRTGRGLIWVELAAPLEVGDGVEVVTAESGSFGTSVSSITIQQNKGKLVKVDEAEIGEVVGLALEGSVSVGDEVYKTRESALLKEAMSTFKSEHETLQIPVRVKARVKKGQPAEIIFCDESQLCGIGTTDFVVEEARRHPLTEETLLAQLDRLGNTPFTIVEHSFELDEGVMVPKSELNEARRAAIGQLMKMRAANFGPLRLNPVLDPKTLVGRYASSNPGSQPEEYPQVSVVVDTWEGLEAALQTGVGLVYLADTGFTQRARTFSSLAQITAGVSACLEHGAAGVFLLPPIAKEREFLHYMNLARELARADVPIPVALGDLGFLREVVQGGGPFLAEASLNPFNTETIKFLGYLGASQVSLSPELTLEQIKEVGRKARVPLEVQVHGPQTLMISEHCVLGSVVGGKSAQNQCTKPCLIQSNYGLKDRMGKVFPLRTDAHCRLYLFNSVELCLIEHLWEIHKAGVSKLRVEGRLYGPQQLTQVLSRYVQAWQMIFSEERWDARLKELLAQYRRELEPTQGITKGHLFRGVI